jgi:cobyrinic acid a,c-diamide synthase
VRAIVVAGPHSGVGKTTVATGLMAALARRGLRVQGFKVGPDYIDPTYHTLACGRPSRNLDRWLTDADGLAELFGRAAARADVCVVEGVMGLFDGRLGPTEQASTAEVAKLLGAPVVLVLDAARMARSAAALAWGFARFDPALRVAGVILNNLGSERHRAAVAPSVEQEAGLPVLGALRRDPALQLPERHLGLVPATEGALVDSFLDAVTAAVEQGCDLPRILRLAETAAQPARPGAPSLFPPAPQPPRARLALARDRAFSFYYQDSLDLLEAWGMELVPFSPLADEALPDCDGVYLGGGFPELSAADLAANAPMLASVRQAAARGLPVYAECGGLMYLGRALRDPEGREHAMVGLAPFVTSMGAPRVTVGYRELRARADGPILRRGERVPGHEFHWSMLHSGADAAHASYDVLDQPGRLEGYQRGSLLASYIHLHLGSRPGLAARLVDACAHAHQAARA